MVVAEKNVQPALAATTRAFHQLQTQLSDTGPGVDDEGFVTGLDFNTGRITAGRAPDQGW